MQSLLPIFSGAFSVISLYAIILSEVVIINPLTNAEVLNLGIGRTLGGAILASIFTSLLVCKFYLSKRSVLNFEQILVEFSKGLTYGLFVVCVSNWTNSTYAFPERIRYSLYFFYALILLIILLKKYPGIYDKILSAGLILLPTVFLLYSKFKILFSDDHAAVIYRLHLLSKYFPNIPIYNPIWNAGTDWRDFFATGILNVYLVFLPLIKLLGILQTYQIIVPTIVFIIFPYCLYKCSRLLGLDEKASLLSSILGLTSSTTLYKWILSYGSMGFVCSTMILPLALGLLIKLNEQIKSEAVSKKLLFWTACISTLTLFWSLQAIALLPVLLIIGPQGFYKLLKHKNLRKITVFFLIINIAWMSLFIKVSKVAGFLNADKSSSFEATSQGEFSKAIVKKKSHSLSIEKLHESFKENSLRINPLIIIFIGISALLSKIKSYDRNIILITISWCFLIGFIGPVFKPQLELDRFIIIASILACIPVSSTLNIIKNAGNFHITNSILCGFIITSYASFSSILQNRGWNNFFLNNNDISKLNEFINNNTYSGRALFTGFILHDLSGGHLAPLAINSKVPLVGSSPVHNLWRYTDVIPSTYRERGEQGIEEYLDLLNATFILAHEPKWRKYFRQHKEAYEEVGAVNSFVGFKRLKNSSYFISGDGEVINQLENKLVLKLTTKDAVIKFNYFPFLKVQGCENLVAYNEKENLKLIKLLNCNIDQEITINSVNPISRLFAK